MPEIQRDRRGGFMLKDVRIMWLNFAGKPTRFDPVGGKREFHIALTEEMAEELARHGFNVKRREALVEGEPPLLHTKVKVNFDGEWSPEIYLITDNGQTRLTKDTVDILDGSDIRRSDLVVGLGSEYNVGGNTGRAAYLNRGYITIKEDEFERMYSVIPEGAAGTVYDSEFQPFDDGR